MIRGGATLLLLLLTTAAAQAEVIDQAKGLHAYSGPVLLKALAPIAAEGRFWFIVLSSMILMGAFAFRVKQGFVNDPVWCVLAFIIAMGCIAKGSDIINFTLSSSEALSEKLGLAPSATLANHVFNIAHTFRGDYEDDQDNKDDNPPALSFKLFDIKSTIDGIIRKIFLSLTIFLLSAILWLCSWVIVIFDTIRYFLVHVGSVVLPIFIAGLLTNSFKSQSINYIFSLIGIVLWPIGWGLGHLGTRSLFSFTARLLDGELITHSHLGKQSITALSEAIATGTYQADALVGACSLSLLSLGSIFCFLIMIVLICLWIVLVTISTPFLIQRIMISGSQFFTGLAAGATQSSLRVGSGFGSMAAARGFMAGGTVDSTSVIGKLKEGAHLASFAAARTLMNAANFSGSPQQLPSMLDTGFDERSRYQSENAEVKTASLYQKLFNQINDHAQKKT